MNKNINKKLFLPNGYLNFEYILSQSDKHNLPYIFIVGGRGTGKTYGALRYTYEHNIKIMLMRRTQTQLDMIRRPELSPYSAINRDINSTVEFFPITKYNSAMYNSYQDDKGKIQPTGDIIGMSCALSTISNMRGFDASDIEVVIYDEFIPEKHERPLKEEASALFNALETIGRNRELQGKPPLKLLAMGNSNNISNEIFISLGLVSVVEKMLEKNIQVRYIEDKGILLINLIHSPISMRKAKTALYSLTEGTTFADMAIHNFYNNFAKDSVKSEDLRQYKLLYILGELAIYKHKSQLKYYITSHISGSPKEIYSTAINSLRKFKIEHREIWVYYVTYKVTFESYTLQVLFEKYHKIV